MKRLLVGVAAMALVMTAAGYALAGGPGKVELYGPLGHAFCDGTLASGEEGAWGFVLFNSTSETISGVVSLKNAEPNMTYLVFLNQEGSCYKNVVGRITTNGQGNGFLRFSDAAVGSWAVVGVFGTGASEQEFASGIYEH